MYVRETKKNKKINLKHDEDDGEGDVSPNISLFTKEISLV